MSLLERLGTSGTAFTRSFHWGVEQSLNVGGQWKREELKNGDTIGTVPVTWTGR